MEEALRVARGPLTFTGKIPVWVMLLSLTDDAFTTSKTPPPRLKVELSMSYRRKVRTISLASSGPNTHILAQHMASLWPFTKSQGSFDGSGKISDAIHWKWIEFSWQTEPHKRGQPVALLRQRASRSTGNIYRMQKKVCRTFFKTSSS